MAREQRAAEAEAARLEKEGPQVSFMDSWIQPTAQQQAYNQAVAAAGTSSGSGAGGARSATGAAPARSAYTDKDYFAMQSALNEAAKQQQEALTRVQTRTDSTVSGNIDYFKQLTDQAATLLAPYQALAKQGSGLYMDALGMNGYDRQQAAIPQATTIFNQQGINAAPLLQSIPGWSYNTAANQASSFMNSMFGGGTNNQQSMPYNGKYGYMPPQSQQQQQFQQQAAQQQQQAQRANDPFSAQPSFQAYKAPADPAIAKAEADKAKQLADLQAKQKGYNQTLMDKFSGREGTAKQADSDYEVLQQLMNKSSTQGAGWASGDNADGRYNDVLTRNGLQVGRLDSYSQGALGAAMGQVNARRSEALGRDPKEAEDRAKYEALLRNETILNPYDAQIAKLQNPDTYSEAAQKQKEWAALGVTGKTDYLRNQLNTEIANSQKLSGQLMAAQQSGNTAEVARIQKEQTALQAKLQSLNQSTADAEKLRSQYEQAGNTQFAVTGDARAQQQAGMEAQFASQLDQYNPYTKDVEAEQKARQQQQAQQQQGMLSGVMQPQQQQQGPVSLYQPQLQSQGQGVGGGQQGAMQGYLNQFIGNLAKETNGRPDAGQDANEILSKLIDPATGAVNQWMNSDVVKNVMDATVGAGTNAVQNAQAARGMLDSGQTLAELQKVGTNAAGQYIVPYAGQLANNVLTTGAGLANSRLTNYYSLLGKGVEFANNMIGQQAAMTQNLANTYSGMGNQFLGNLQSQSNVTANTQNALQQGGLSQMLAGGQAAAAGTADIYGKLGNNVAGQNVYGNDMYGNTQMLGAGIEANRLKQNTELQILQDQYERAAKNKSMAMGTNAGGLALSLGMMALGGL